jgi:hypothetical protein
VDKYIPLFPTGFLDAKKLGYIDENDPPNGSLCLQCGASVVSRWLHDNWHLVKDGEEEEQ